MFAPPQTTRRVRRLLLLLAAGLCRATLAADPGDPWNAGLIYDQYDLTLSEGIRTEMVGPFYYREEEPERTLWALPPLFSRTEYPEVNAEERDVLFPLWTYDRHGQQGRWQFLQIISRSWGDYSDDTIRSRLTLFPFYFHQRSTNPDQNYTAVWPIFGHLDRRLYYSGIDFVLWPIYVKTKREASVGRTPEDEFISPFFRWREERRVDVTTYNVLAPFFHYRTGPGMTGWQAWPLFHWEQKSVGARTNSWGEAQVVPGYTHLHLFWPLFFYQDRRLGTENEEHFRACLPFFSGLRSPARDSTSYLWPIGLTLTDDRARGYHEVGAPWPFIVFARGEGKTTDRVWPFYGRSFNNTLESRFILWPVFKYNAVKASAYERRRSRILWFLYSHTVEEDKDRDLFRRRVDLWPVFTHRREMDGSTRLQILALLEPWLPNIKSIERNYSPLWSLWRSEHSPKASASSQSLLWNLYRSERREDVKKCSLLFGLFQYQSGPGGKGVRVLYIPIARPDPAQKATPADENDQAEPTR